MAWNKRVNANFSIGSVFVLSLFLFAVYGLKASAGDNGRNLITKSRDWSAYKMKQFGSYAFFASSIPTKKEGKYKKRGLVYLTITHRPKMGVYDVISFEAGYSFKKGSDATVTIDKKHKFKLATLGETAWCRNVSEEKKLLKAMLRGNRLLIEGVSTRGTKTKDTYSLNGLTKAFTAISKSAMKKH